MINSFVFLNNTYDIYRGTNILTGGNPNNTLHDSIIELDSFMGGAGCGVNREQAWEGKFNWVNTYAPGTTTFAGMVDEDFTGWDGSQYLTRGVPTIEFLLGELLRGEDVELRIGFEDGSGHYVTLTGLNILDNNNNGMWDPDSESAFLEYIDPNCPNGYEGFSPGPSVASLSRPSGTLMFGWRNGNGSTCNPFSTTTAVKITAAWAESPVPEPGTLLLLGVGMGALVYYKWRHE
jgi:hypothetical protein